MAVRRGVQEGFDQTQVTGQASFYRGQACGGVGGSRIGGGLVDQFQHQLIVGFDFDDFEAAVEFVSGQATQCGGDARQVHKVANAQAVSHIQSQGQGVRACSHGKCRAVGHSIRDGLAIGVKLLHGHGFGQHGVAKTVNRVGKLGADGGVDGDVVACKSRDVGAQLAHKFAKHQVLVFHFCDQLGRLEQHFASPEVAMRVHHHVVGCRAHHECFDLRQHTSVFRVEHVMDRAQADVFVAAAVACDKVFVQQFVVKGVGNVGCFAIVNHAVAIQVAIDDRVGIGCQSHTTGIDRASCVGNVVQEGVADGLQTQVRQNRCVAHVASCVPYGLLNRQVAVLNIKHRARSQVAGDQPGLTIDQEAIATSQVAQETHFWNVQNVHVFQGDANQFGVGFDVGPSGHATVNTADQIACDQAVLVVFTQKHGVAGAGTIRLAQVDERRHRVDALLAWGCEHQLACVLRGCHTGQALLGFDGCNHSGQVLVGRNVDGHVVEHQHTASAGVGHIDRASDCGGGCVEHVVGQAQSSDQAVGADGANAHLNGVGTRCVHQVGGAEGGWIVDVKSRQCRVVQRIICSQRDNHSAVGTLVDKIQAVVKKLTKHGGEGAGRQGVGRASEGVCTAFGCQSWVVQNGQLLLAGGHITNGGQGFWTLVGHDVADHAGRSVNHCWLCVQIAVVNTGDGSGGVRCCGARGCRTSCRA